MCEHLELPCSGSGRALQPGRPNKSVRWHSEALKGKPGFQNGDCTFSQLGLFSQHHAFKISSDDHVLFQFRRDAAASVKSDYPEIPSALPNAAPVPPDH